MFSHPIQKDTRDLSLILSEYQDFVWLDSADGNGVSILAFASKDEKIFDHQSSPQDFVDFLDNCARDENNSHPLLFTGGWIGYLSYEAFQFNPLIPFKPKNKKSYPLAVFRYYDTFIYVDHKLNQTHFVSFSQTAKEEFSHFTNLLKKTPSDKKESKPSSKLNCQIPYHRYQNDFSKIKDALFNGSYFELNYSMEYQQDYPGSALDLYLRLREITKAPMMAYFDFPEVTILSSSPERFFEMNQNQIKTYPIKGTIGRGLNPVQDEENKAKLMNSAKDQAELLMVTDMLRNDLGRICKLGSVQVKDLARIYTFSHYHHLIAEICGDLLPHFKLSDVFQALFPGGSITGAPKIEVMKHIDQLENRARGIYTGALGYISQNGRVDFNIPIRTLTLEGDQLSFATGSGIVADSVCDKEYQECQIKASGLLDALNENHV